MSAQQYKKVLSIAEALLRKVDMPQQTVEKYESLKTQILSQGSSPATIDGAQTPQFGEISSQIKDEIVWLHQNFLATLVEIITCMLQSNPAVAQKQIEGLISPFFEAFEQKKRDIRDVVLESSSNVESRLGLKQHLNSLDEMEISFESAINLIAGFQDLILQKSADNEKSQARAEKLEDELDEAMNEIKTTRSVLKEVELLKLEKEGLVDQIKRLEMSKMDIQKSKELRIVELEKTSEQLREENRLALARIRKMEQNEYDFCALFSQYCEAYKGPSARNDFSKMLSFAGDFVGKLEGDNRWLLEKVGEGEAKVGKLTQINEEYERESAKRVKCVDNFVEELGEIVQANQKTHMDIEGIRREYEGLLCGGISKKGLYIAA